jgi:hypothetical protein
VWSADQDRLEKTDRNTKGKLLLLALEIPTIVSVPRTILACRAWHCSCEHTSTMGSDEDERCAEWARAGFCEQEAYQAYMEASCAGACVSTEQSEPDDSETPTCEQWVSAGYCEVAKYKTYMDAHCKDECSVGSGNGEEETPAAAATGGEESKAASASAEEPATCEQWSRQGFCKEGQYLEYMKQNCKRACASAGDVKVAGAAAEKTAEECAGWAARGYCHNAEYAPFMTQNCASICRDMPEITFKEELPPPVDVWTIFLIVGFGAAVSYLIRLAYSRDVSTSAAMRSKNEPAEIGTRIGNTGSAKRSKKRA